MSGIPDFEAYQRNAPQSSGVVKSFSLDVGRAYFENTGGPLSAGVSTSVPVGLTRPINNLRCITFHASADDGTDDIITFGFEVPFDFRNMEGVTGRKPSLELWLRARKAIVTGTPTDNADLALEMVARIQSPSLDPKTGVETAGGAAIGPTTMTHVMPPLSAIDSLAGARFFKYDVLAGLTDAERKQVKPGASVAVSLGLNEAVGADQRLDIFGVHVFYIGHANPPRWVDEDVQA